LIRLQTNLQLKK